MTHRILGYSDRLNARPGESVDFKVSSEIPGRYEAGFCRLISGDDSPAGPGLKMIPLETAPKIRRQARRQEIACGSYIRIAHAELFRRGDFSLQAMIYPTLPKKSGPQAILGNFDRSISAGYALFIDEMGRLAFRLGAFAPLALDEPLLAHHWYHIRADHEESAGGRLRLKALRLIDYGLSPRLSEKTALLGQGSAPGGDFLIGAWRNGEAIEAHFNGKIDSPSCGDDVAARDWPIDPAAQPGTIAAWDFSRHISGERIQDRRGRAHGRTWNRPTRAVTGWNWDGSVFDWRKAPHQYGAIHFHDDDLADCRWRTDFRWSLPADLPSGVYCAHLTQKDEAGEREEEFIPLFVAAPKGRPSAPLALLVPTASYLAYANHQMPSSWWFDELSTGKFTTFNPVDRYLEEHEGLGLSVYDIHNDGSGVCYSSALRPILNMRPKTELWQFNADLHIVDWLEALKIPYDILTDHDLHREGVDCLKPYRAIMTGTHPEYYSLEMLRGLLDYTGAGGRLVYLGANGFYWRIAFDPKRPEIIEHRRAEDGMRGWIAEGGEYHMSLTGELGGLWRRMGYPPQAVCGVGFTAQGFLRSVPYRRTKASFDPRAAFIFDGIGPEETIGDFGALGGGAAGWEVDRADFRLGTPPHALILATAEDFPDHYHWVKEEMTHTHSAVNGDTCPLVRCDMVFYETPLGGAVFSTGSIAWGASLAGNRYDNNVSRLTANVLRRFVDPAPFL